jgi:hypothetical protein
MGFLYQSGAEIKGVRPLKQQLQMGSKSVKQKIELGLGYQQQTRLTFT